jgi:hypothetical protein
MVVFNGMLAGSITPLVVLAIAAAALGNEVEDRTLANLTLSAVPRWQIAVPKLLARSRSPHRSSCQRARHQPYVAFLGDATATSPSRRRRSHRRGALLVGVRLAGPRDDAGRSASVCSTSSSGKGFFSGFVSGVRLLSIRYYAIGWMHVFDERRFISVDHPGALAIAGLSTLVIAGFVLLSVRRLRRMDVP